MMIPDESHQNGDDSSDDTKVNLIDKKEMRGLTTKS